MEDAQIQTAVITRSGNLNIPDAETTFSPKSRPWIGSYFGIPEPTYKVEQFMPPFTEWEIHILRKDLSTRIYTLTGYGDMCGNHEITAALSNLAYTDVDAIAYIIYSALRDEKTGEFKRDHFPYDPCMRVDKRKWRYFDYTETDDEENFPFDPFEFKSKR